MSVQGPGSLVPRSRNLLAFVLLLFGSGVLGSGGLGSGVSGAGVSGAGFLTAQQPFRSGTRTVAIYATVIDASGRLVTDLGREHFTVYDNGKPQPVALFANDPQDITMTAMLDTSGSMANNVSLVRNAAMALVSYLRPDDRVRLGSFGGRIMLSPAFTSNTEDLARFLWERLRPGGGTPLWDAVDVAMDTLADRQGRRVVLVFSDGNDRQSRLKMKDIMRRAQQQEFMIYAIGCWGAKDGGRIPLAPEVEKPDGSLRKVADETGGGYAELLWTDDLDASFRRVADELHSQYLIGFSPAKADGKLHKLEVRVDVPGLTVRTRKSYVAAQ